MSTGVVPVTGSSGAAPEEPGAVQVGGDQPPMEFTPVPSAAKAAPVPPSSARPVVTPPPHSNPVVTLEVEEPRMSVVGTTVMPSVSLPELSPSTTATSAEPSVPVP